MSDTAVGALIGAASAVLTLLVKGLFDSLGGRAEERRWYAEFFLQDKIKAMKSLHEALVDLEIAVRPFAEPFSRIELLLDPRPLNVEEASESQPTRARVVHGRGAYRGIMGTSRPKKTAAHEEPPVITGHEGVSHWWAGDVTAMPSYQQSPASTALLKALLAAR